MVAGIISIAFCANAPMSRKRIFPDRNAATATSFAPFTIQGAVPPVVIAAIAVFRQENVSISGFSKVNVPTKSCSGHYFAPSEYYEKDDTESSDETTPATGTDSSGATSSPDPSSGGTTTEPAAGGDSGGTTGTTTGDTDTSGSTTGSDTGSGGSTTQ